MVAVMTAFAVHAHLAGASSYVVQEGDTLSEVALRLGVSVEDLAEANGISDPDVIVAGKMLVGRRHAHGHLRRRRRAGP
jgi:hypothetical protein